MRPVFLNPLFASVSTIDGVGPKVAILFSKALGKKNDEPARLIDLLLHLPINVFDRRLAPCLAFAKNGEIGTFQVRIVHHNVPPRHKSRAPMRILCEDDSNRLDLVFFGGQQSWVTKRVPVGAQRIVSGKVDMFDGHWQMAHPDYILPPLKKDTLPDFETVYRTTQGLGSKQLHKSITFALKKVPDFEDWLDSTFKSKQNWPHFKKALFAIHAPTHTQAWLPQSPYRQRLAYDELLAQQLALGLIRAQTRRTAGRAHNINQEQMLTLSTQLPFALTGAQQRAIKHIQTDLASSDKMIRLIQGDVGSGKTMVALFAMAALAPKGQSAMMAPTELLARQHFKTMQSLCAVIGLNCQLFTGKMSMTAKREILKGLADGSVHIVVGTHALFQNNVAFHNLCLSVVDEQHRFGVHQRLALSDKGLLTDMLVMTATPIPRTLVMAHYGDMDVSVLDEKPQGRQPIDTKAIQSDKIDRVLVRLAAALKTGAKAYWVCPLVEESDMVELMSAQDRHAVLDRQFKGKVGLVHGRMKENEKQAAMTDFLEGKTQILVATTVIEVGLDVPDATIMIIEHAERFGLAQLHQLRGRVGRGAQKSSCLLIYQRPLGEIAQKRLDVMIHTEDGFVIAQKDLELRGTGDVLGTQQSGMPGYRLVDPAHHMGLLPLAHQDARTLLTDDPDLHSARGKAIRHLLHLFEKQEALPLLCAG